MKMVLYALDQIGIYRHNEEEKQQLHNVDFKYTLKSCQTPLGPLYIRVQILHFVVISQQEKCIQKEVIETI
jgi:hypothetical protein